MSIPALTLMATCVTALPHFCNRAGSNWSAERQGRPQRLTAVRSRERHAIVIVTASAVHSSRAATLRRLLEQPGILKGPCCHDGLSARLIEQAGFPIAFMSGFCVSAARLGAPDTGLISYQEMVDQGRYMHEATQHLPIIGDGDTGYGNAMNVKRTVRGYAASGFAGILIEDQVAPKSCGHVKGKHVVSREEAVSRIRAAVDAREEGSDIVIVARTDARQALSLEEALWRAAAFADAGADVVFIDALASREELRAFAGAGQGLKGIPKMANMLEGGGKTPILSPEELEALGFKLVAYPLSLLGVSIQAMQSALQLLQQGQVPGEPALPSFSAIQTAIGFDAYFAEERRYAVSTPAARASQPSSSRSPPGAASQAPHSSPSQPDAAPLQPQATSDAAKSETAAASLPSSGETETEPQGSSSSKAGVNRAAATGADDMPAAPAAADTEVPIEDEPSPETELLDVDQVSGVARQAAEPMTQPVSGSSGNGTSGSGKPSASAWPASDSLPVATPDKNPNRPPRVRNLREDIRPDSQRSRPSTSGAGSVGSQQGAGVPGSRQEGGETSSARRTPTGWQPGPSFRRAALKQQGEAVAGGPGSDSAAPGADPRSSDGSTGSAAGSVMDPDRVLARTRDPYSPRSSPAGSAGDSAGDSARPWGSDAGSDSTALRSSADDWRLPNEDFRKGRFLRLKVTDRTTGDVKIDTRFPAGFLDNLASFVPAVAGVDLEGLIKNAKGDASWTAAKPVADFSSNSDVIQIFLE